MTKSIYTVIPEMTHPYGKAWEQPKMSELLIDDKYACMSIEAFNKLKNYSRSRPTGVYEGKMWKKSDNEVTWHLHWWDVSDDPDCCKGHVREILILK